MATAINRDAYMIMKNKSNKIFIYLTSYLSYLGLHPGYIIYNLIRGLSELLTGSQQH